MELVRVFALKSQVLVKLDLGRDRYGVGVVVGVGDIFGCVMEEEGLLCFFGGVGVVEGGLGGWLGELFLSGVE